MILNESQLDSKISFIKDYIKATNAANGSKYDANANVSSKNVATLSAEIHKDVNIQIKRALITEKIRSRFGEELAREYNRQIEDHEIYVHDESALTVYCLAMSLYPFLTDGLKSLGGESGPPKHLESFCGGYVNLLFAISSQVAGAVGVVETLAYFDYFARKDYGDDYLKTHEKQIANHLQHIVYALNQPAAARSYQAVFFNISIFDKHYFESLFGDFRFPDGSAMNWGTISELQKYFMRWFNKEREKAVLTFPVVTASILHDDNEPKDESFADFLAGELSEGNSFFIYSSNSPDSLSSCCFGGEQKTLTKSSAGVNFMTFKEIYEAKWQECKRNFTIFHNGSWTKGKIIKVPNRQMFKVKTSNNKEILVSDNHLNPTLRGDIPSESLTTDDYFLFNSRELNSFPERDEQLTYSQGYAVGAFLGDGSFGKRHEKEDGSKFITEINYSLNKDCYDEIKEQVDKANRSLGGGGEIKLSSIYNNVYPSRIYSKELAFFIQKWTKWKEGTIYHNKELNMDCLLQSSDFRHGILEGWYATDGGNSNRCYTTSTKLAECMEALITSIGMSSIIDIVDRTDEKIIIRGEEYNRNYPLYCVRWYDMKNKRSMENIYKIRNNSVYFKIKSIERINYSDDIYCFEMKNKDEPYFTLPNGIITHNCRLRNQLSTNNFSHSLGAGGVSTGSMNVITINFNRLVQKKNNLKDQIEKIHKYQVAFKDWAEEMISGGMMPIYDAGFISLKKQYLTIGVNGVVEAAEYLGLKPTNNNKYKEWVSSQLRLISELNKEAAKNYDCMFNTEFVPAEGLGVKFAKWDKEDGLIVPRDCYNSYFYPVEDSRVNVLDKFILHGRETTTFLDGGSALHVNLEQHLDKNQYKKLIEIAVKTGCNYFCINVKVTICEDCGHVNKQTKHSCVKCGSGNISYATRIIGYLKKINSWSEQRKVEEKGRFYHK